MATWTREQLNFILLSENFRNWLDKRDKERIVTVRGRVLLCDICGGFVPDREDSQLNAWLYNFAIGARVIRGEIYPRHIHRIYSDLGKEQLEICKGDLSLAGEIEKDEVRSSIYDVLSKSRLLKEKRNWNFVEEKR